MFKNYFKTAIRSFLKNKVITIITVLGLSIGISAALVIYQIVQYDYSFDQFEPDRDRIYRVVTEGPGMKNAGVPSPLHEAVQNGMSGVAVTAPFFEQNGWGTKISIPQSNGRQPKDFKKQEDIIFSDGNYFRIFPHRWMEGSAAGSLAAPNQVVLSESRAGLYFPGLSYSQIIGRQIIFNDTLPMVVSGIVKDLSAHTDFNNKVFISLATIPHGGLKQFYAWDQWHNINSVNQLFLKLTPETSPGLIDRQLARLYKQHNKGDDGFGDKTTYRLQPLSDIHFNTDFEGKADRSVLRNLVLLAVFLLLLGAINFINLSTAQASQRAREIGVRKTLGSTKGQLIGQFLTETFLLTLIAAIFSLLLIPFLLNIFSGYIPEGLHYGGIGQPGILLFLLALVIVVSLLSGFYPALILAQFKPITVIRNQASSRAGKTRSTWVRKTLIVSQFVIAQVFIICVLMVNKQIRYAMNKDMGFKKEAIINFYLPFDFFKPNPKKFVLKNKLQQLPGIEAVSLGNQSPAFSGTMTTEVKFKKGDDIIKLPVDMRNGDTAYLRLYHIKLLAGRNILPTDSATEFLINETLARQLGFQHPRDAIGKFLNRGGGDLPIVGVMADFNEGTVRRAIHPLIYYCDMKRGYVMHVALQPDAGNWQKTIAQIQSAWHAVYPDRDFDYKFLDKTIENFYKQDIKLSGLLAWSAGIAIFIGCLGLLGLVIFTANQRTKEIGIRKVLGASVTQIIALLSKDFIALVAVAFVIAVPIAWIAMNKWLQNFAYHTALSWWIFILSGGAMLILALIILSIRAGRAARANPVEALRME